MRPITLFLMGYKGYHVLRDAVGVFQHLFKEVIVARDPNVSNDYFAEIVALCNEVGLRWIERSSARPVGTGYAVAISWRWLIDLPPHRLIIFHDSLLPRYRGFNPLVSYLINGETNIGVTALFGADEYDRGDIIAQASVEIDYPIKIARAIELITNKYQVLAREIFATIANGQPLVGVPQDESCASFSLWRDDKDYCVPWDKPAEWIARLVDAVGFPYKGASTLVNGSPARLIEVEPIPDVKIENRVPGKVAWVDGRLPIVVCGTGMLKIIEMYEDENAKSLIPLKQFRTRFT